MSISGTSRSSGRARGRAAPSPTRPRATTQRSVRTRPPASQRLPALSAAALLPALAGCGGTKTVTRTVRGPEAPAPGRDVVLFGHAKKLTGRAGGYRLTFDPALWLSGTAAEEIALESTGSRDVPNDHIVLDEGNTALT